MKKFVLLATFVVALICLTGAGLFYVQIVKDLPNVEDLREVRLQTPLRIYTSDNLLIAEFGKKRRKPVAFQGVPKLFTAAFIAAEDASFFSHAGVDWMAVGRAAIEYIKTGEKRQGGSTITMQVARNFFLSSKKTFARKFKELVLARIIEQKLSKNEILQLYLNKIFLGHRAYGIGAAAQVYYGLDITKLNLAQMAMIAGLPKAPSRTNPITNPEAAKKRRYYVLSRMHKLGYIGYEDFQWASSSPITAEWHGHSVKSSAPHLAEMVRDFVFGMFGDKSYEEGYRVITTINGRLQMEARESLRDGLAAYDRRHGYRGAEGKVTVEDSEEQLEEGFIEALRSYPIIRGLIPGIVNAVEDKEVRVRTKTHGEIILTEDSLKWARKYLTPDSRGPIPETFSEIFSLGDVVRITQNVPAGSEVAERETNQRWGLTQLPEVEGAIVSLNPKDGAIISLAGGLDFKKSKFNRVTQARRQVGSNFKPFLYSAALEKGYTAASIINDAPIVFKTQNALGTWRPENFSGKFFGPTRLRQALVRSQNMVSVRLLDSIGIGYTINYVSKFGYDSGQLPRDLSLALGSGEMTPLELATGYSVFANGGFLISPYFIKTVETLEGELVYSATPGTVCQSCDQISLDSDGEPNDLKSLQAMSELPPEKIAPRIIASQNSWLVSSMLRDVIKAGTGRRAKTLGRVDLAGKTGTTNEQRDAWFSGFNTHAVTTVWVGFDKVAPLGRRETGAKAALPIWISYMQKALENKDDVIPERPDGLVVVRIDKDSGEVSSVSNPQAVFEVFRNGNIPSRLKDSGRDFINSGKLMESIKPEQVF